MIEQIKNIIKSNEFTKNFALKVYNWHQKRKDSKEFTSRIKDIKIDEYIDTTCNPDLNVIFLIIDCLRYSNLSFTGYERETTPFLDSLKVKFKGVSAAPWTYPAVASILTGLYPHNHNAYIHSKIRNFDIPKNFKPIRKSVLTLPEILFLLDYELYFGTAIDVASYPFRGRVVPKRYFDILDEKILNDLRIWISKRKKPFFIYAHLRGLHEPLPQENLNGIFGKVEKIPNINTWDFKRPEEQKGREFERYKINRILLYDNTLRRLDGQIEWFYSYLEKTKLLENSIIVITSDHGEEFWEHAKMEPQHFYDPRGYYGVGHGHNVFNEIVEIPILIDGCVNKRGEYTSAWVSSVDITPTVLELLGISHNLMLDGENLFEIKNEKRAILSEAVGYGYEKKALFLEKYKLIYAREDNVKWLFDLDRDPKERNPIMDEEIVSFFVNKMNEMLKKGETHKLKKAIGRIKL
mgnify:CR=1 FL=1